MEKYKPGRIDLFLDNVAKKGRAGEFRLTVDTNAKVPTCLAHIPSEKSVRPAVTYQREKREDQR